VCFGHQSNVNYRSGRAPVPGTTLGGTGPGPQSFYVSLALDTSYDLSFANDSGSGLGPTAVAVIAEFDPVVVALQPASGHPFLNPDVSQGLRVARADVPHFTVSGVFSAAGTLIAAPGPNKYLKLYDASAGTGSTGVGNGTPN